MSTRYFSRPAFQSSPAARDRDLVGCMDVWGGNQPVDAGVMMAGLDAWVYSQPFGGAAGGGDVYYVSSCATGRITRLFVLVRSLDASDPARLIRSLLDSITRGSGALADDEVTALLFRPNVIVPRLPLRDRVAAPLRPGGRPMGWPQINLPNIGGALFSPLNRLWNGSERDEE